MNRQCSYFWQIPLLGCLLRTTQLKVHLAVWTDGGLRVPGIASSSAIVYASVKSKNGAITGAVAAFAIFTAEETTALFQERLAIRQAQIMLEQTFHDSSPDFLADLSDLEWISEFGPLKGCIEKGMQISQMLQTLPEAAEI